MKRLTFIRNIGLVGAAVTLAPAALFSANSGRRIDLGEAGLHVPHGNFFEAPDKWVAIEEMNIECSVDRYMRNGVEEHELDLVVYKIKRENEIMLISKGQDGFKAVGKISGLTLSGPKLCTSSHVLDLSSRLGYLSLSRQF